MQGQSEHHVEFWTRGIFPIQLFEKFLEKELQNYSIVYLFTEEKRLNWYLWRMRHSLISIALLQRYFSDFVLHGKGKLILKLLLENLKPIWDLEKNMDLEKKPNWSEVHPNRFEFICSTSDGQLFHFPFPSELDNEIISIAFEEMLNFIKLFESSDENIHRQIHQTLAEKEAVRFFKFETKSNKWNILNHLKDITLSISEDYFKSREEKRIGKPDIMINEEKFNEYFVWDQQWALNFEKVQVVMARPNDVALYLNLADKSIAVARPFLEKAIKNRTNTYYLPLIDNKSTSLFYDYFENVISAIIFSFTAIEAFSNICIVDGYEFITEKDGVKTIYSKQAIEKRFSLREKLKDVLPQILKSPDPTKEYWWQKFVRLEDIRDKIIHTKQSNSIENYSFFLSKEIFELIETSKEIIKYYGSYLDENCPAILIDYPFGYGFENVIPFFLTNDNYLKQWKNMRGIP